MVFDSLAKLYGIRSNKKLNTVKWRFCTMKCIKRLFSALLPCCGRYLLKNYR